MAGCHSVGKPIEQCITDHNYLMPAIGRHKEHITSSHYLVSVLAWFGSSLFADKKLYCESEECVAEWNNFIEKFGVDVVYTKKKGYGVICKTAIRKGTKLAITYDGQLLKEVRFHTKKA